MQYETITTDSQLRDLCDRLSRVESIAFDTEFVSEDTYWSHLCLIQVAADEHLAVIDPLDIRDLTPFWETLASGDHETIVHAGREELIFSLRSVSKPPARLFDIQIAAGLVGYDYPAGYGSLIYKVLGKRPPKGETRTDWRRRPLSKQQIEYALSDVVHLQPVRDALRASLQSLKRETWMKAEIASWMADVEQSRSRQRWRKVSGISGLSPKGLAIVRELWQWRDEEAQRQNRPVRRVLRDDLIVELAKRATADPKRIMAVRGLDRPGLQRWIPHFVACIERALASPDAGLPRPVRPEMPAQLNVLGQFLSSALTSICRRAQVAPSIVGTASDVRDLIAYRQGFGRADEGETPVLATGWRAEVVGNLIDDLLTGRTSIRIQDPQSEEPLAFEPVIGR